MKIFFENIVSSNKAVSISNRILKEIVAPYLTIIDAFHLYRTCQHFFVLFGENYFGEWLKENQEILKLLYKTSQLEKHKKITVSLQKCNFTLKFPPGIFLDDEDDLRLPRLDDRVFDFRIVVTLILYIFFFLSNTCEIQWTSFFGRFIKLRKFYFCNFMSRMRIFDHFMLIFMEQTRILIALKNTEPRARSLTWEVWFGVCQRGGSEPNFGAQFSPTLELGA